MSTTDIDKELFKQALKEALTEALREQRDLFQEIFAEVLDDFALAESIRKGRKTSITSRDEVFRLLGDEA